MAKDKHKNRELIQRPLQRCNARTEACETKAGVDPTSTVSHIEQDSRVETGVGYESAVSGNNSIPLIVLQ